MAVATGLYQLTPLKSVCLRHCRSPLGFFMRHGKHLDRPTGAFVAGGRHGLFCVGCCWMLMAVLIAFGTMQLAWMLILAVLILLEKAAPFGEQLARVTGRCCWFWVSLCWCTRHSYWRSGRIPDVRYSFSW